jgi:hypothetical protein
MESAQEPKNAPQSMPQSEAEQSRGRSKRSNQRRTPRGEDPVDERRARPRSSERTGANGFRDGLDHASCVAMTFTPSPTGIVFARTGVATMVAGIVARRDDAVLHCDRQHSGPHVWPDGQVVESKAD